MASSNYLHLEERENAEKELALSSGELIIAAQLINREDNIA